MLEAGDIFLVYPFREMTYYADSEDRRGTTGCGFSRRRLRPFSAPPIYQGAVIHSCTFGC